MWPLSSDVRPMNRTAGFVSITFGVTLIILGYAGLRSVASVMDAGIGSGTREMSLLSELRREPLDNERRGSIEQYIELHRSTMNRLGDIKGSMVTWSLAVGSVGILQFALGAVVLIRVRGDKIGPNSSLKRTDQSLRD
jgi:hypothetical protein